MKQGYASDVADAIVWACGGKIDGLASIGQPAKVISMSFTGRGACPSFLQSAVTQAIGSGSIVVAAAGNSAEDVSDYFPANCVGVLSVGASTEQGKLAEYSNWGSSILAPGGPLWAMTAGGALAEVQGTSFATPHAAGLLARLLLLNSSAAGRLLDGAQALNGSCLTETCSAGIADYAAALALPPHATVKVNTSTEVGCANANRTQNASNYVETNCDDMYFNGSTVQAADSCSAGYFFPTQEYKYSPASISNKYTGSCPDYTYVCLVEPLMPEDIAWNWGVRFQCCDSGGYLVTSSRYCTTGTLTGFGQVCKSGDSFSTGFLKIGITGYFTSMASYLAGGFYIWASTYSGASCGWGTEGPRYSCPADMVITGFYGGKGTGMDEMAPYCNYYKCQACPAGTYSASGVVARCSTCSAGTYSNAGAASCTGCSAGTYSGENSGSCTSCTSSCASGQYLSTACSLAANAVCSDCPAGSYCVNTVKTQCGAGNYSAAGASSCTACSTLGTYSYGSASSCKQCTPITTCAAGYYITQTLFTSCNTYACVKCSQIKSICCGTGYYPAQTTAGSCTWTCVACNNAQAGVQYYITGGADNCGAPLDNFNANTCYTATCSLIPVGYYSLCSGVQDNGVRACSNAPANSYSYYYSNSSLPVQTTNACPNALCPPCPAGKYTAAAVSGFPGGCANTAKVSDVAFTDRLAYGYDIGDSGKNYFVYCSASCPDLIANAHYYQNPSWQTAGQDPQLQSSSCSYFVCNTGFYKTSGGACVACPSDGCAVGSYRMTCSPDGSDYTVVRCQACSNAKPDSPLAYSYGVNPANPGQCLWACRKGAWYDSSRNVCVDCVARSNCPVGLYSEAACLTTDGMTEAPSCLICEYADWIVFTGTGLTNDKRSCPFRCYFVNYFIVGYGCQQRSSITCPSWTQYVQGNATSDDSCAPCDMTGIFAPYKAYMQQCVAGGYSNDACSPFVTAVSDRYLFTSVGCRYWCANGYTAKSDGSCGPCPTNTYWSMFSVRCETCESPQYTACNTVASQCLPADPHAAAAFSPSDACAASNPFPFYCNAGFYAGFYEVDNAGFNTYECKSCGIVVPNAMYIAPDPLNRYPCTTSFFSCNAGYYANITAFQCVACPASTLSNTIWAPLDTAAISLSDIPAQLSASCRVGCNSGYFMDANARACVPCPPAYYCPDYTAKVLCNSTYYCPALTVALSKCATGFYCPNTTSQLACPQGSYNNISGATSLASCIACTQWGYATQKTLAATSCTKCSVPVICSSVGTYMAQVNISSCEFAYPKCTNAAAGYYYAVVKQGSQTCGAASNATGTNNCYTAPCPNLQAPFGFFNNCTTGPYNATSITACSNAAQNSYYSALTPVGSLVCPTAVCPACAAGIYTPRGCYGSSSLTTPAANVVSSDAVPRAYCSATCPPLISSVQNAYYSQISSGTLDPQAQAVACQQFTCNSGYYSNSTACLPCPQPVCQLGYYCPICAADGSDHLTLTCLPCTNRPTGLSEFAYGYRTNGIVGDPNACIWRCRAGSYMQLDWNTGLVISCLQCFDPALKCDTPGTYLDATCLLQDDTYWPARCDTCLFIRNDLYWNPLQYGIHATTSGGKVDDYSSCAWECNDGLYWNPTESSLCSPWSLPTCTAWTTPHNGNSTIDSYCSLCPVPVAPFPSYTVAASACIGPMASYTSTTCLSAIAALAADSRTAYNFSQNNCSFKCNPGFELQNGLCVECQVNFYNNITGGSCRACAFPAFAPCEASPRTYCAAGVQDAAGLLYTGACPRPPFYCRGGFRAQYSAHSGWACQVCSNNPSNSVSLASDASNQCSSPNFTCALGYYQSLALYACSSCGTLPSNAAGWRSSLLANANASDVALQRYASCGVSCNTGFYVNGSYCVPCPTSDGCALGFYRPICAANGSDHASLGCLPCTNRPGGLSVMAIAYGNNKVLGSSTSCMWGCTAGSYQTINSETSQMQCMACVVPPCAVGYYPAGECMSMNYTTQGLSCVQCSLPHAADQSTVLATATGFGRLNAPTSCGFQCNSGYFDNTAIVDFNRRCQQWSSLNCPVWTFLTPGTATADAMCAPCSAQTAPYAHFADDMALCVSGAYSSAACSNLASALSAAYIFVPNACAFQCYAGYERQDGVCVQCPVNFYNPVWQGGGICEPCIAPSFTPCAAQRTYCAPGVANQAGLLYTDTCASQKPPIYCNGGYMPVQSGAFISEIPDYICADCTNNPVNATYLAPDPENQCNSPNFACALGFYQSLATYTCASCGALPAQAAAWVSTLDAATDPSDVGLQRAGSCNVICNAGYVNSGAGTCSPCQAGSYAVRNSNACVPCSLGSYCPAASTAMSACPAENFCPDASTKVLCAPGSYCPAGSAQTVTCPAGSYCPNTTIIVSCDKGYHCTAGITMPQICTAGYVCPNAITMTACATRTFCPAGSTASDLCSTGFFCPNTTTRSACISGQHCPLGSLEAQWCPEGSYCPDFSTMLPCDVGVFCPAGLSVPKPCAAGAYCPNTTSQLLCKQGSFCPTNSTQEQQCLSGFYCPNASVQMACNVGFYCPAASTAQSLCQPGSYCPSTSEQIPCEQGSACLAGATMQKVCPAGFYCVTPNSTVACSEGYYCPEGQTQQTQCQAGFYCPNASVSLQCLPTGYYCPAGLLQQQECRLGFYCPNSTAQIACSNNNGVYCPPKSAGEQPCKAGAYCPNSATQIQCQQSAFCPTASMSPQACLSGFYCSDPSTQVQCGVAYYCAPGSTAQSVCAMGYFRNATNGCSICAAGTYSDAIAVSSCSTCSQGSYCPAASITQSLCPPGYYCSNPSVKVQCAVAFYCPQGSTQQVQCAAGYAGTGTCVGCPPGTFSRNNTAQCTTCSLGNYCPALSPDASACPAGSFCPSPATIKTCNTSYYCPAGSTNQSVCAQGYYCANTSIQVKCGAGYYCPQAGMTQPNLCPLGYYCPTTASQVSCTAADSAPTIVCSSIAVGGDNITSDVPGYYVHQFLAGGTITFAQPVQADVIVIGGGGGGAGGYYMGGGGGAGALVYYPGYSFLAGTYDITVGAPGTATVYDNGGNGGDSIISLQTVPIFLAKGGGGGGIFDSGFNSNAGLPGGCSGGASATNGDIIIGSTAALAENIVAGINMQGHASMPNNVFGNAGGTSQDPSIYWFNRWSCGGGGGCGTAGSSPTLYTCVNWAMYIVAGKGGDGISLPVFSSFGKALTDLATYNASRYFIAAGGGGGNNLPQQDCAMKQLSGAAGGLGGGGAASSDASTNAVSGARNTGSGGGAGYPYSQSSSGGQGGSGLVLIKYAAQCSASGGNSASKGTYCPAGSSSIQNCSAGYYCPSVTSQVQCLSGQYCPALSSSPLTCTENYYCPNATVQLPCPTASFASQGSTACIPCSSPLSYTTNSSRSRCSVCAAGSYSNTSLAKNASFLPSCTGGCVVSGSTLSSENFLVYNFTQSGTMTVSAAVVCDVLLVGGGGSGGSFLGGGGGAGGVVYQLNTTMSSGLYSMVIGAGGKTPSSANGLNGVNGQNTSILFNNRIFASVAQGGGGGGTLCFQGNCQIMSGGDSTAGLVGGSSGGAGTCVYRWFCPERTPASQGLTCNGAPGGYAGATGMSFASEYYVKLYSPNNAGGGGGAGGPAQDTQGGPGVLINITGIPTWFAGGGGGLQRQSGYGNGLGGSGIGGNATELTTPNFDGLNNTGSGGAGAALTIVGAGGSGIAIIRVYMDKCALCPAGAMSDANALSCTQCPPGSFSRSIGSSTCTACVEGTYTDAPGMTSCLSCASAQSPSFCSACSSTAAYAPKPAATACLQCPLYALASLNGSTCLCAPGMLSLLSLSHLCKC